MTDEKTTTETKFYNMMKILADEKVVKSIFIKRAHSQ